MAIEISSGGLSPSNATPGVFPNYAGRSDVDDQCESELRSAGIIAERWEVFRDQLEVKTSVRGTLHGWLFERAWYYWVARGPGVPPQFADKLHESHGKSVRVDGHCGCPSPLEWCKGFAVSQYHVDTPDGLAALAETLREVASDGRARMKRITEGVQ